MKLKMISRANPNIVVEVDNSTHTPGEVLITGTSAQIVILLKMYFNKSLSINYLVEKIPEKFVINNQIQKHTDEFLLEYFVPEYVGGYNIEIKE